MKGVNFTCRNCGNCILDTQDRPFCKAKWSYLKREHAESCSEFMPSAEKHVAIVSHFTEKKLEHGEMSLPSI